MDDKSLPTALLLGLIVDTWILFDEAFCVLRETLSDLSDQSIYVKYTVWVVEEILHIIDKIEQQLTWGDGWFDYPS